MDHKEDIKEDDDHNAPEGRYISTYVMVKLCHVWYKKMKMTRKNRNLWL